MRVVEEKRETSARRPPRANAANEIMRVPLVNQNEIRMVQRAIEIEAARIVANGLKVRIRNAVIAKRRFSRLCNQVLRAPRVTRLVHADVVPARDELRAHATQKVRVAVIPVGRKRMAEDDDAHGDGHNFCVARSSWDASSR